MIAAKTGFVQAVHCLATYSFPFGFRFRPLQLKPLVDALDSDDEQHIVPQLTDLDLRDPRGHTALMLAAGSKTGKLGVIQILVENGANTNLVNWKGKSALMIASEKGRHEVEQKNYVDIFF